MTALLRLFYRNAHGMNAAPVHPVTVGLVINSTELLIFYVPDVFPRRDRAGPHE